MKLPRDLVRRLRRLGDPRQLGWPGMLAAALLAGGAGFHFSVLLPEQERLDDLRARTAARAQTEMAADAEQAAGGSPADQLDRFHQAFPPSAALPDRLDRVFAVAREHGIGLDQGDYKLTRTPAGGLERVQVTLPVRSTYPQVRKFIAALRAEIPGLALDHIQFQRQKVADATVEATIRLALYMVASP